MPPTVAAEGAALPVHPLQPVLDAFAQSNNPVFRQVADSANRMLPPASEPRAQQAAPGQPATPVQEPAVRAAMAAAENRPDMLVALDDGVQIRAADVIPRAHEARRAAEQESSAFEAAINCLLRSGA